MSMDDDVDIDEEAEKVASLDDFVRFLGVLEKEIQEDDEAPTRLQSEFIHVVAGQLRFAARFSDDDELNIEAPEQPDWNWLARMFVVGVFEN